MKRWITNELCELTEKNMDLLLDFKIPGILVKGFIDPEICQTVSERLISRYGHMNEIPVNQQAMCHNRYSHMKKSVYFFKKKRAEREVAEIYHGLNINPVEKVIEALRRSTKRTVGIYHEDGYGDYFAGAFRSFKGHGKLHVDHAPSYIHHPWAVTQLQRQLSWNIYYTNYEGNGGELIIYDTVHSKANDHLKVVDDYCFPYEVLESQTHCKVKPMVGDLVIFNTQHFHEIMGHDQGCRISQTSFIGLGNDGGLRLWS
ncbi:TPA: 2OG-Fe(II) oxygenase [Aeromonas hydrophila]